jgi:quercetin dioxygenase-like cupin family protein
MKRPLQICTLLVLVALTVFAGSAEAQVFNMPLPELPDDQEMLVVEVNLEAGQPSSAPHRHNAHVFVYVLEGRVNMQVAGGELQTLSPGEMFYEDPNSIHTVSQNASDTEPARFLVHIIKTVGAPVTVPAGDGSGG